MFSYSNIPLVSLTVCLCLFGAFTSNRYLTNSSYKFYFRCSCQRLSLRLATEDVMLGLYWKFQISSTLLQVFLIGQPEYDLFQILPSVSSLLFWDIPFHEDLQKFISGRWMIQGLSSDEAVTWMVRVSPSFLLTAAPPGTNIGITLLYRDVRQIDLTSLKHWNFSLNLKH